MNSATKEEKVLHSKIVTQEFNEVAITSEHVEKERRDAFSPAWIVLDIGIGLKKEEILRGKAEGKRTKEGINRSSPYNRVFGGSAYRARGAKGVSKRYQGRGSLH